MKKITVAIDGFSSTGKSTLAKELAKKLNYSYVDTGAMYRAVAYYALENELIREGEIDKEKLISRLAHINITFQYDPSKNLNITFLNGHNIENEIRGIRVSNVVSAVASIPEIRKHLVDLQKKMGLDKGVVMDGRDIGTVVFPDAELKIFMTADPKIRAGRRHDELVAKGQRVSFEEVLQNLEKRDHDDRTRLDSPLLRADDALELDNSHISREEQFNMALGWALERMNTA